jgi:C-terminal processing protease CtpA/Prc
MGELVRDWHVCDAEKSPADGNTDSGRTCREALFDELTELARSKGLDGRVELAVGTEHPAGGLGLVLRGHSPPRVVGLLSAAALSGMVQVGDELASIDGIRANGMGIEELTALMAGDIGTRCTLSLIRRSELVEVTLERREMSRSRSLGISFQPIIHSSRTNKSWEHQS